MLFLGGPERLRSLHFEYLGDYLVPRLYLLSVEAFFLNVQAYII